MRAVWSASTLAIALIFCSHPVGADDQQSREQIVKLGKPATGLVECVYTRGRAHGSAFCLHPSGLFATNAHVVTPPATGLGEPTISIIIDPGLKTQRVLRARVVRIDKEKDLALLKADDVKDLPILTLGADEGVTETTEVIAFGFPFGTQLSENKVDYPSVSVNVGSVTALRRKGDDLHRIQVDAVLNPGNSGGPALGRDGKVLGVVVSGVRGSQVNFLIPVSHLADFLAKPQLEFRLPAVENANRHREAVFEARAVSVLPKAAALRLELVLKTEDGKERRLPMEGKDGVYRVRAVPLPTTGPLPLRVVVTYSNGSVSGTVVDRTVKVNDRERLLSDVQTFQGQPKPRTVFVDGQILDGPFALETLEVPLGAETLRLKLADAVLLRVEPVTLPAVVACTVIARQGDAEVGRISDSLSFAEKQGPVLSQPLSAGRPTPPADVPGKTTVDLVPLLDPKKDALENRRWEIVDKELRCPEGNFVPRIQIPYQPPEEYDFVVTFSQASLRNGVALIMPHPKGGSFFWTVGADRGAEYGLFSNANKFGNSPGLLKANTAHTTIVQVRRDGVRAFVDGKEMARADYRDLTCDNWRTIKDKSLLGLSCDDPTVFHYVRVIEITGSGKKLR